MDSATQARFNANNASGAVRWVESSETARKTKTCRSHEGLKEPASCETGTLNALPVDSMVEVPVRLPPKGRLCSLSVNPDEPKALRRPPG